MMCNDNPYRLCNGKMQFSFVETHDMGHFFESKHFWENDTFDIVIGGWNYWELSKSVAHHSNQMNNYINKVCLSRCDTSLV